MHRHCTTVAPQPPAFVLGYGLPFEHEIPPAVALLAEAVAAARADRGGGSRRVHADLGRVA